MSAYFPGTAEGAGWFAACDPAGSKLGSGGGVAHLLAEAWRSSGGNAPFEEWCDSPSLKLTLMAGGQSRRLPAYAATGKILMPFPALRWADGQRLDQTLLDVQMPGFGHIAARAPLQSRVMVASGDVLLRFPARLPAMPDADILGLGMWVDAHTASHFGVFFTPKSSPEELAFFLQKPKPDEITKLAADHLFLVDTGLWLLSAKAVADFDKPDQALLPAFEALDIDGDGVLTRDEVLKAMLRLPGGEELVRESEQAFDALDVDKSGTLDYEEFVTMMSGGRFEDAY